MIVRSTPSSAPGASLGLFATAVAYSFTCIALAMPLGHLVGTFPAMVDASGWCRARNPALPIIHTGHPDVPDHSGWRFPNQLRAELAQTIASTTLHITAKALWA